jgi:hypothetical protein
MKYLKTFKNLFTKSIEDWCEKLELKNYSIKDGGLVYVDGAVDIQFRRLNKFPVKFGIVTGFFNCRNNKLRTLKGSPIKVSGSFECSSNDLISLEGCTMEVNEDFFCDRNNLTSLVGGPKEVGVIYYCYNNKLVSLEGIPDKITYLDCLNNPICEIYYLFPDHKSYLDSLDFNYLRGDKIVKGRLSKALKEIGIYEVPDIIPGYEYI